MTLVPQKSTQPGWRRTAIAGSALAALALLGGGVLSSTQAVADPAAETAASTGRGNTVTASGPGAVAALYAAVTDLVPGKGSDFAGQTASEHFPMAYGELAFAPSDGSPAALVSVNLQDSEIIAPPGGSPEDGFGCDDFMEGCQVSSLPDGSLLRTYTEHDSSEEVWRVAERVVGKLRVVVMASNGLEDEHGRFRATRDEVALSIDQLTEIVSQPRWNSDLSAGGGGSLPAYKEYPTVVG